MSGCPPSWRPDLLTPARMYCRVGAVLRALRCFTALPRGGGIGVELVGAGVGPAALMAPTTARPVPTALATEPTVPSVATVDALAPGLWQ